MNVKEASAKWGVSESTVKRYCALGMVAKCKKEKNQWIINDDSLCPLPTGKKSNITQEKQMKLIIKAINEHKTINPVKIGCDQNLMTTFFIMLVKDEMIFKIPNHEFEDCFRNYILTPKAIKMYADKESFGKWISELVLKEGFKRLIGII